MRKIFLTVMTTVLMLFAVSNVGAADGITIYVNEQVLECDVAPFVENNRTMVPMRKIFEALDTKVDWEGSNQVITATKDDIKIMLQINNPSMYNNGRKEELDVAPKIVSGSTFVPIRAVSQSLNASVIWFGDTNSIYIDSPEIYASHYNNIANAKVTLYALDGRTIDVLRSEVPAYLNVGWYATIEETQQVLYALDGRTITVYKAEVPAYLNVGWYATIEETQQVLYAPDGRTITVYKAEVPAYLNVGWYATVEETQQVLYAPDGRTITVYKGEVPAYLTVGWYASRTEAQNANRVSSSENRVNTSGGSVVIQNPSTQGSNTQTSGSPNSNTQSSGSTYNPGVDGNYYRTPTGKRYHLDPNCGGKNSYKTDNISGLTPCQKCAK